MRNVYILRASGIIHVIASSYREYVAIIHRTVIPRAGGEACAQALSESRLIFKVVLRMG